MEVIFWLGIAVITYTYIGYPLLLFLLVKLKRMIRPSVSLLFKENELPYVSLIIACYNEGEVLREKIQNTLSLDYPADKLNICFVTDGTSDGSERMVAEDERLTLFHSHERKGKNAAINRVLPLLDSPILIFCDANTFLNKEAIFKIVRHYKNENVGAVAGEKRVESIGELDRAGEGEGAYWKYESALKKWDAELKTVVGAAGELFSVRKELMEKVPDGILIEDFYVSVKVAQKGYKVVYEPDAYAVEGGSASISEERKRKVRISAGGLQAVWLFMPLLNIFKYGWLSFQYVSHRVLRWTLAPMFLVIVLLSNIYLAIDQQGLYIYLLVAQSLFYAFALMGKFTENMERSPKVFFIPFYFVFMNLSVFQGFFRLVSGRQSAVWEKAERAKATGSI
ncbi:glycosyltransferase family 2 protein [Marivirga sp. S37H4]|uniref:Glycosyltransferase family 2 protein n=1 Tax=Marivirga aurantiaca TaxID=2802615 RepID=A0A934X0A6_9BACT|nr:glycosyltransferase family 2 protein [Marivirga aurantiaca]MBK6266538.1 glycosyltransferase family 2 protein [Marivirga aurantiaca]